MRDTHPIMLEKRIFELEENGGGGGTTNYNQLTNKPKINNVTLSGNKSLADIGVASADDITEINSDLNGFSFDTQEGKDGYIKNGTFKPFSTGEGGTSDYNQLTNKPQIEGTTLEGNTTFEQLNIASATDLAQTDEDLQDVADDVATNMADIASINSNLNGFSFDTQEGKDGYIKNGTFKPFSTGEGGTSDYSQLTNKPQIEGITLEGNKSLSDLDIAKASDIGVIPEGETVEGQISTLNENLTNSNNEVFKFGYQDGKRGYIVNEEGADTFYPFKSGITDSEMLQKTYIAKSNTITFTKTKDKEPLLFVFFNKSHTADHAVCCSKSDNIYVLEEWYDGSVYATFIVSVIGNEITITFNGGWSSTNQETCLIVYY